MAIPEPVLVTGATGFVGGHLVESLRRQGVRVRLLVRDPKRLAFPVDGGMRVVRGDVTDASSLREAVKGVRSVVHLAAVLRGLDYGDYERVNVGGTRLLCEQMAQERSVRKLVYASSLAAAGPSARGRELTEKDPALPLSFYGITKRRGEEVVLSFARRFDVTVLRPGAVYGPRDRDVLQYFKMVRSGFVFLHGDGLQEMSFVHVADVVQAVVQALGSGRARGKTFFVCDGRTSTWGDLLGAAGRALGKRYTVVRIPIPMVKVLAAVADGVGRLRGKPAILNLDKVKEARCEAWTCSNALARRVLGFKPRYGLEKGVAETMAWCRKAGWI